MKVTPITARGLRAQAEAYEAEAARVVQEATERVNALRGLAVAFREQAAKVAKAERPLRKGEQSVSVHGSMLESHRLAISAGHSRKARKADEDPFFAAINKRGHSMRSLAATVGIKPATLSAHRKPTTDRNHRPIPRERAERIKVLTGWPADDKHWPAGFSKE